jgi:hypothetical protein
VYQVRLHPLRRPVDLMAQAATAVWSVLKEESSVVDLSVLAELLADFRGVWKGRLTHYESCGNLETCRIHLRPALWDQPLGKSRLDELGDRRAAARMTYTLETRRDIDSFIDRLAGVVLYRLRRKHRVSPGRRALLRARLMVAVRGVLAPHVYHSDVCASCASRAREREGIATG